jgi:hypothetical protein
MQKARYCDRTNQQWCTGYEVLTPVVMKSVIFWDKTSCSPLEINQRLGGTCRLHLQGERISQARNLRGRTTKQSNECYIVFWSVTPRKR